MAKTFEEQGCTLTYGDFMFGLRIPLPIHTLKTGEILARITLPLVTRLPQRLVYPTGKKQRTRTPKFQKYFNEADIIAGDLHYIHKYSPENLKGKVILTTTTTNDLTELRQRGVTCVVTSTPEIDGRSFGSNIIEAMLHCIKKEESYQEIIDRLKIRPSIKVFE